MQHQIISSKYPTQIEKNSRRRSLQNRADEVLLATVVLGLLAILIDGDIDFREIRTFRDGFRKRFALTKGQAQRFISLALPRIRTVGDDDLIDCSCDTLNEYLDTSQKLSLFEALTDVLVADGRIDDIEEDYFDYIAERLNLHEAGVMNLRDALKKHRAVA